MATCRICGKTDEYQDLYEGIYEKEIVKVCENCAELEEIPIIRKPTSDQLQEADRHFSVRERMENMSKPRIRTLGRDQQIASTHLSKIKFPPEKQNIDILIDNYYWAIQHTRRKMKISINQVSSQTGLPVELIQNIEKGQLPKDFEAAIISLENFYNIVLLKSHQKKLRYSIPEKTKEQKEIEILEQVRETIKHPEKTQKNQTIEKIKLGTLDFSKKKDIQNITLNDLIEAKKQKQKYEAQRKTQKQTEELIGDEDIEIIDID